jgi:Family of unknown function (DUF6632)
MSDTNRLLFLRIALVVIGLTFIFGIYTLGILWPSGWVWGQGYSHYLMMIIGVYATLGVSSGSPCGRVWFMEQSWAFRLSWIRPSAVI